MAVTYQLRAPYVGNYGGGTVSFGPYAQTFNVGAALTAGGGSIVVVDAELASALDRYPPVYRAADDGQPLIASVQPRWSQASVGAGLALDQVALELRRSAEPYARWQLLADGSLKTGAGSGPPVLVETAAGLRADLDTLLGSEDRTALKQIAAYLTRVMPDRRGDAVPLGLRRAAQWRRPLTSVELIGAGVPEGWEAWEGLTLVPEDDTGPERINATAGGMALDFLAGYAIEEPGDPKALRDVYTFAEALLPLQWMDPNTLRYGGFMASPNLNTCSSFGTGTAGLGFLEAWRATAEPRYLDVAVLAADFCERCSDPNTYWFPKYGVNPINRTVGGTTWYGFCDEVTATDKITTGCALWNLKAAELCRAVYDITGVAKYLTAANAARDFMAFGALNMWSFFQPSTNVDATYVQAGDFNDHAWHTDGDFAGTTTIGTDQPEYALPALLRLGYSTSAVLAAYDHIVSLPHDVPGGAFGLAFDPEECWTGYLRKTPDRFYAEYYDTQGAGTTASLKALHRPSHYEKSRAILLHVAGRGGILDQNHKNIWQTFATYKSATQGTIVAAGAGRGILNARKGVV